MNELFTVKQVNLNCFKVYLGGVLLNAYNSQKQVDGAIAQIKRVLGDYIETAQAGAEPVTAAVTATENTENQIALVGSAETGGEKAADWYEVERHATNLENLSYVYAESFLLWQARVDAPLSSAAIAKFLDAHQRRVTELLATIGGV